MIRRLNYLPLIHSSSMYSYTRKEDLPIRRRGWLSREFRVSWDLSVSRQLIWVILKHPSDLEQQWRITYHILISKKQKQDAPVLSKLKYVFANSPDSDAGFEKVVRSNFLGALTNKDLVTKVVDVLARKDYNGSNNLLATYFCFDELARQLEDDFNGIYGNNFNLGGLAGFPFAGGTGFNATAAHIPEDIG